MPGQWFPGTTTFYLVTEAGGNTHTEPFTNNKSVQWIQLPNTMLPVRYTQFPLDTNICDVFYFLVWLEYTSYKVTS